MLFGKRRQDEKQAQTRKEIEKISEEIAEIWNSDENAKQFDANGWYPGNPKGFDVPEQGPDDL